MKEGAPKKGIHGDRREGEGVKVVCGDEIVGAFLLHILHPLGIAEDGEDEVDEIGEGIEGLADEFVHVGILAEEAVNVAQRIVFLPDHMAVENIVQDGDEAGE